MFINSDSNFSEYIEKFYNTIRKKQQSNLLEIDNKRTQRSENYSQFYIGKKEIWLRIDFVNDVAPHYGKFSYDKILGKIDSLRNILSNKLSAIFRYEPKDIADILIICKNLRFNYKEIIDEAKGKEAGVDPVAIYEILNSFPIEKLKLIKWVTVPMADIFKKEISQIAEDILYGSENSLANKTK